MRIELLDARTGEVRVFDHPIDAREALAMGVCVTPSASSDAGGNAEDAVADPLGLASIAAAVDAARADAPTTNGVLPMPAAVVGVFDPAVASRSELLGWMQAQAIDAPTKLSTEQLRARAAAHMKEAR